MIHITIYHDEDDIGEETGLGVLIPVCQDHDRDIPESWEFVMRSTGEPRDCVDCP